MSEQEKPTINGEEILDPTAETHPDAANLQELIAKTKARMEVANNDAVKELLAINDAYKAKTTQPAKDPNWVPPWEDLPGSQPVFKEVKLLTQVDPMDASKMITELAEREPGTIEIGGQLAKIVGTGIYPLGTIDSVTVSPYAKYDGITDAGEIIPGMLSEIHEKIKMARYLGTHSARHDLPEASNYEDGAFFIIPEEHKFYMVINNAWLPFKSMDGINPIIETTQDAAAFAKKIMGIKTPPIWDGIGAEYSSVNGPGNVAAQPPTSTTSVSDILSGTSVVTAMSLMESTGMTAKELIENSSVSESKQIIEDAAVAEVVEAATALRDSGVMTETGIEGVVEITKTENHIRLKFGNMDDMQKVPLALPVTRSSTEPINVKPAETIQPDDVPEPQPEPEPKVQEFAGENTGSMELLDENIRQVTVPISAEHLREYFSNKGIFYVVNYSESKLKGLPFLNYLTNLAVPCDVKFNAGIGFEEYSEIMLAYMKQNSVTNMALLNVMAAELMLFAKGLPYEASPYALAIPAEILTRFIDENKEMVDRWLHFIDSTHVYGLYAIKVLNAHYKPAEYYEVVDDAEYVGSNVVQLYRIPEFTAYYFAINGAEYKLSYFKKQFEEYMFKNNRMSFYFRSKNNFAALMYEHLALGTFKASDVGTGIFGIGVFAENSGVPEYDAAPTE